MTRRLTALERPGSQVWVGCDRSRRRGADIRLASARCYLRDADLNRHDRRAGIVEGGWDSFGPLFDASYVGAKTDLLTMPD